MGGGQGEEVTLNCTGEFSQMKSNEKGEMLGMASLKAPRVEIEETEKRAPIDIICVIDRSGSMAGAKLNLTKAALSFVIDQLDQRDSLAIVTYDTNVATPLDLIQMSSENKEKAKKAVNSIQAGAMTNLSGGLLAGLTIAGARKTPADICSVLLFTDGLANVGITSVAQITAATEAKLKNCRAGTSVFTFGFGADTDATMLRAISSTAKGMYYFLETVDQIPLSFADCIGGLQSVVAQNIRIVVQALNGATVKKVLSTGFKFTEEVPGTTFVFQMGDIYSEEERDLLLKIELPSLEAPSEIFNFLHVTAEYFNILLTCDEKKEAFGVISRFSSPSSTDRNKEVDKQYNRVTAAEAIEQARVYADSGDFESAKVVFRKAQEKLISSPTYHDSSDAYTRILEREMKEVSLVVQSEKTYLESGRNKMMSKSQSHAVQRSSETSSNQGMYETKSKAKKKAMFH